MKDGNLVLLCIFLCFLLTLMLNLWILYLMKPVDECYTKDRKTYVTFSTIPDRLNNNTFVENVKYILSLLTDEILILNLPRVSRKGQKYIVPNSLYELTSDKFIINWVEVDEGPITKLLPSLRNKMIKSTDIIIIIDDDVYYKHKIFKIFKKLIFKNPEKIVTFCNKTLKGFRGIGFVKNIMQGLENISIPDSCIKIDDFIIQKYVKHKNIPILKAFYTKTDKLKVKWFDKLFNTKHCNTHYFKSLKLADSYNAKQLQFTTNRIKAGRLCKMDLDLEQTKAKDQII